MGPDCRSPSSSRNDAPRTDPPRIDRPRENEPRQISLDYRNCPQPQLDIHDQQLHKQHWPGYIHVRSTTNCKKPTVPKPRGNKKSPSTVTLDDLKSTLHAAEIGSLTKHLVNGCKTYEDCREALKGKDFGTHLRILGEMLSSLSPTPLFASDCTANLSSHLNFLNIGRTEAFYCTNLLPPNLLDNLVQQSTPTAEPSPRDIEFMHLLNSWAARDALLCFPFEEASLIVRCVMTNLVKMVNDRAMGSFEGLKIPETCLWGLGGKHLLQASIRRFIIWLAHWVGPSLVQFPDEWKKGSLRTVDTVLFNRTIDRLAVHFVMNLLATGNGASWIMKTHKFGKLYGGMTCKSKCSCRHDMQPFNLYPLGKTFDE